MTNEGVDVPSVMNETNTPIQINDRYQIIYSDSFSFVAFICWSNLVFEENESKTIYLRYDEYVIYLVSYPKYTIFQFLDWVPEQWSKCYPS